MKKTIFLLIMILYWIPAKSQNKNEMNQNSQFTYCEIVGTARLLSTKINVEIDFGQSKKLLKDNRYKDSATGKPLVFNSMIDALNFMGQDGWEFVQAYTIGDQQTGYVYHFLLKKETSIIEKEETKQ